MGSVDAVHSVSESLVRYLNDSYPEGLQSLYPCSFDVVSSHTLNGMTPATGQHAVTLYLYRIETDPFTRNQPHVSDSQLSPIPLSLGLHYLLIIWSSNAQAEQTIATWCMSQLQQHSIFDRSMLSEAGDWERAEEIHIVPHEISNEDLWRLWESLKVDYRLSLPYVARPVTVTPVDELHHGPNVVATRFAMGELNES